jgi:hypothetical protein
MAGAGDDDNGFPVDAKKMDEPLKKLQTEAPLSAIS